MLKTEFWSIIDDSRKEAGDDGEQHVETLKVALEELEPNDLISFQHWFDEYFNSADTWGVWGAAYVIGGGCSDDGFLDFKAWLVSRGEKTLTAAVANPDSLAKVVKPGEDCQVEGFQCAAQWIWTEKAGKDFADFPLSPLASNKDGIRGQAWSEDDLGKLFPKLSKKFG
jgi:hypothetical protein